MVFIIGFLIGFFIAYGVISFLVDCINNKPFDMFNEITDRD